MPQVTHFNKLQHTATHTATHTTTYTPTHLTRLTCPGQQRPDFLIQRNSCNTHCNTHCPAHCSALDMNHLPEPTTPKFLIESASFNPNFISGHPDRKLSAKYPKKTTDTTQINLNKKKLLPQTSRTNPVQC